MTTPERLLWHRLRSRGLYGLKFRRQVPLGPYVVDFICKDKGVIVEVDGESHAQRMAYDALRDSYLYRSGYFVLRIFNREVMENLEGVLERISEVCGL